MPSSEYAPAAIRALFKAVDKKLPQVLLGGIVGDRNHAYGYHRSRTALLAAGKSGDYSVVEPLDKKGDANAASALDLTFPSAGDMRRFSKRLMTACLRKDPRLKALREWFGTVDSETITGYSPFRGRVVTSSDMSHLYHIHLSLWRAYANDEAVLLLLADLITDPTLDDDIQEAPMPSTKVDVVPGGRVYTGFKVPGSWAAGYHTGEDWHTNSGSADLGKRVNAPVSGKVVHAGWGGWGDAYGIHVIIQDSSGDRTACCHLRSESVSVGEHVNAGDQIGKLGSTGNVTGPHVHVERRHSPFGYWQHEKPQYGATTSGGGSKIDNWDGKSFPGVGAFKLGQAHQAVTVLDKRLIAHGYAKHHDGNGYQPGPTFTKHTLANVKDFQKAQGWTGSDADGYPGPSTWSRLMAAPKASKPSKPATKPKPKPKPKAYPKPKTRVVYDDKVKPGQKNSDSVYWVQVALNAISFKGGKEIALTGTYDAATKAEAKKFQTQKCGDPADGDLGPKQTRYLFQVAGINMTHREKS